MSEYPIVVEKNQTLLLLLLLLLLTSIYTGRIPQS